MEVQYGLLWVLFSFILLGHLSQWESATYIQVGSSLLANPLEKYSHR